MDKENKKLLIELCSRLPHGTECFGRGVKKTLNGVVGFIATSGIYD